MIHGSIKYALKYFLFVQVGKPDKKWRRKAMLPTVRTWCSLNTAKCARETVVYEGGSEEGARVVLKFTACTGL